MLQARRRQPTMTHRQQQLGAARQPHRQRQADAVRRSAPAVLGAVDLVRIRPARAGGRCRRRRASGLSRHVVGQQRQHRLGDHQQRGLDARPVSSRRSIRLIRSRYRDGDTWREFDERTVEHPGARRGGARTDHPLDRARPGGERAGAVARCGRRSAAVAALGRHGAHGRHPRLASRSARARDWAEFPRGAARLVGGGVQLRLCRCGRACRLPDGRAHADPRSRRAGLPRRQRPRPISGRATSRSTNCRTRSTRRAATLPAPTSASCRTIGRSRSTARIRRAIAACGSTQALAARRRWTRGQHRAAERREELPRRTAVSAYPAASAPATTDGPRRGCSATGTIAIRSPSIAPTLFETFMALWQREVIGQHLPERLLDLTHQQTGLAPACWKIRRSTISRMAPRRTSSLSRSARSIRCARGSAMTRRHGSGAASTRRTGITRSATPRSTSARARWTAVRTRCATPAASCRRTPRARRRVPHRRRLRHPGSVSCRAEHRQFWRAGQPALPGSVRTMAARRVPRGAPASRPRRG